MHNLSIFSDGYFKYISRLMDSCGLKFLCCVHENGGRKFNVVSIPSAVKFVPCKILKYLCLQGEGELEKCLPSTGYPNFNP